MNWKEAAKLAIRASPFRNPLGVAGAGLIIIGLVVMGAGIASPLSSLFKTLSPSTINIPFVGEMPTIPQINIMGLLLSVGVGVGLVVVGGLLIAMGSQVGQLMVLHILIQKAVLEAQKDSSRHCSRCGSRVPEEFKFCLSCGAEVG